MKRNTISFCALSLCIALIACGSGVSGHVYHTNGGVLQVEFQSGGRAYLSNGTATYTCRYAESKNTVSLSCNGDRTDLKVQDDGALVGPANGNMARLTPVLK